MRASASKRGYGKAHRLERAKWKPIVDAGSAICAEPVCLMPTRWIKPGSPWHLSHNTDGTAWIGPSHRRCNLAENARRNNPKRGRVPRLPWLL